MDVKEIKESLRGALPRGTASKIREKLLSNSTKEEVSISWISRVISPDTEHWDDDIIQVALEIAKERREKLENLKALVTT